MVIHSDVVHEPISVDELLERVRGHGAGALLLFLGTVRNHHEGRPVNGLQYEAYEGMAREVLDNLLRRIAEQHDVEGIAAVHRVGDLGLGEVSLAIAVASAHRADAYQASRAVLEEIKRTLPVWKKELYADGDAAWVPGWDPREPGSPGVDQELSQGVIFQRGQDPALAGGR